MKLALLVAILLAGVMIVQPTLAQQRPAAGTPAVRFLGFSPALPSGDQLLFRQAVASAIDREAAVRAIAPYADDPRPVLALSHTLLPGFNQEIKGYPFDPAAAKRFWEQLPEEARLSSITILVRAPDDPTATPTERSLMLALDEAVRESISKTLGITVTWQRVSNFRSYLSQATEGKVPIYMFGFAAVSADHQKPGGLALAITKLLIKDSEIQAAVAAGDAAKAEQLTLQKALLVPIVQYRFK